MTVIGVRRTTVESENADYVGQTVGHNDEDDNICEYDKSHVDSEAEVEG